MIVVQVVYPRCKIVHIAVFNSGFFGFITVQNDLYYISSYSNLVSSIMNVMMSAGIISFKSFLNKRNSSNKV